MKPIKNLFLMMAFLSMLFISAYNVEARSVNENSVKIDISQIDIGKYQVIMNENIQNVKPCFYVTYYSMIKEIAFEKGYAIGIHGSVVRDFDLIAVPWTEKAVSHNELLKEIQSLVGMKKNPDALPYDSIEIKPHNRIAYTIQTGGGGYFDISILKVFES